MKRTLLAALLAAGSLVSAQSFASGYFGDENDTSWLYSAPTAKPFFADSGKIAAAPIASFGDENDTSWLYSAPTAKPLLAESAKAASPSTIAHYGDENDLSWLYKAPTARVFRDDKSASNTTASVR
jgi:hypothetical protein